jgi:hypothetical protein
VARFYPVSPLFWTDARVKQWGTDPTLLALYFLTCEHRNLEGLYRVPPAYIQSDLGWSEKEVRNAMRFLLTEHFIEYDEGAQVVFVRNALKYQAPQSKAQIKGALNALQTVPETRLLEPFLESAETHAPALRKALEGVVHTHSNGSR